MIRRFLNWLYTWLLIPSHKQPHQHAILYYKAPRPGGNAHQRRIAHRKDRRMRGALPSQNQEPTQ